MPQAWATRRSSFDACPDDRRTALTLAKEDLSRAAGICRYEESPSRYAQAIHLLAHVELDLGHEERARTLWEETRDLHAAVDLPQGVEEAEGRLEGLNHQRATPRRNESSAESSRREDVNHE